MQRSAPVLVALWLSTLALAATPPQNQAAREFNIAAGEATRTLNEYSRQAGLQVLFDFARVKGSRTDAAVGKLTPIEALDAMLKRTGLLYYFVNDRTLAVVTEEEAQKARRVERPRKVVTKPEEISEVKITAARLFGRAPVGRPTFTFDRVDIERSGAATVPDFLQTLPQVFGGGPTEDTPVIGREALTNSALGVGVNLRGLDAGATLVLLNGQRMARGGTSGAFVDVSNIPLSAVDRIEILSTGGSPRHGAEAVSGVVNFVLRDDFVGVEAQGRFGGASDGALHERQVSLLKGAKWDSGRALLAFEYYDRDALWAADRERATSDLRPWGGDNFDSPFSNPGTITDGFTQWAIPDGQDGRALTAEDLIEGPNLRNRYKDATILPQQHRENLVLTARQELSTSTQLTVDALLSERAAFASSTGLDWSLQVPASNPFYLDLNGDGGPVTVLYNLGEDFGPIGHNAVVTTGSFSFGANANHASGWRTEVMLARAYEQQRIIGTGYVDPRPLFTALADPDPRTAFNPFGAGSQTPAATVAAISVDLPYNMRSRIDSTRVSGEGPLLRLPAGQAILATGAEWRQQSFRFRAVTTTPGDAPVRRDSQREIVAAFGELRLPLVGDTSHQEKRRLELSLAGRYERYSDFGSESVGSIHVEYAPRRGFIFRGGWSEAYRVPTLPDLDEQDNISGLLPLLDLSAGTTTPVLYWAGKNADLTMERASTWSVGFDILPPSMPNLSLGLTYFDVEFKGRIEEPLLSFDILNDPVYAHLVTRDVTDDQQIYVCTHSVFPGGLAECLQTPIGALVDLRLRNSEAVRTRGVDLTGEYVLDLPLGRFGLNVNGSYVLEYSRIANAQSPRIELSDTQNSPIDLRLRAEISLRRGRWDTILAVNYADDYLDIRSEPYQKVDAWVGLDLQVAHVLPLHQSGWGGIRAAVNVQNIFNQDPPFLNNSTAAIGYDQENGDLLGRSITLSLSKQW